MAQYILAHDVGTSGNKATLYSLEGKLTGSMVAEYPTYYPHDGWVEQDANDWWRAVCDSTKALLEQSGVTPDQVACISFSAQMMGCLLVDGAGEPLRNMLIWADTRSSAQERFMLERVNMERGYHITGHRLSASYSAAKLLWVKDNQPELYQRAYKMIHAKDYLVYKLTGQFMTDYSDASGTNLLDLERKEWSQELLEAFEIRADLLPELSPSTHVAGGVTARAAKECGLLEGTPVVLGGGDGSCACVGAGVVQPGKAYNVIGSSSWISMAAQKPYFDPEMRTFNWVHLDENLYTPCGTMQAAGYSYAWFRNTLGGEEIAAAKEQGISPYELLNQGAADSAPGANGVLFLPYLLGERSPLWDHSAKGAFIGMGISTTKGDMTRAVLEGVGYNLKNILDILENYATIEGVTMIGGGTKGDLWLQILADIWQKPLYVPGYLEEATSMGAAICGGVGIGAYSDFTIAETFTQTQRVIHPNSELASRYHCTYRHFRKAYDCLRPLYEAMASRSPEE